MENDLINSPEHYNKFGFEVIDLIDEVIQYTKEKNIIFNMCNALKYTLRSKYKNNELQDLLKAKWYILRCKDNINNSACLTDDVKQVNQYLIKLSKIDFDLFILVNNIISFCFSNSQRNYNALLKSFDKYIKNLGKDI